jgi:hypothetical protein
MAEQSIKGKGGAVVRRLADEIATIEAGLERLGNRVGATLRDDYRLAVETEALLQRQRQIMLEVAEMPVSSVAEAVGALDIWRRTRFSDEDLSDLIVISVLEGLRRLA